MRIAMIDDEKEMLQKIHHMIEQQYASLDVIVDCYQKSREFFKKWEKDFEYYQILLFDIEMPELDGIELAKKIREKNKEVPIIFLTGYVEYALKGYEVNAIRYLTKPVEEKKLFEALKAAEKLNGKKEKLLIHDKYQDKVLDLNDILYMEAINQDIYIVTLQNEKIKIRYNLKEYEAQLKENGFVRCHRGYLVHMKYIKSLEKTQVTLQGGITIPVSRMKYRSTKEIFYEYIKREAV